MPPSKEKAPLVIFEGQRNGYDYVLIFRKPAGPVLNKYT
jgi:hypothetical protein